VHAGFKDMADQVWGALSAVLDAEVVDGAGKGITDILIGGHSVGGALGTLLSARTQVRGSTAHSHTPDWGHYIDAVPL
jgi:hypothetical protein